MKYYEIRDMNDPTGTPDGYSVRIIDEDELDGRIEMFRDERIPLTESKQILLHGKVNEEPPDPWEEWADGAANAICDYNGGTVEDVKDVLLKLKTLVEKKD